MNYRLFISCMMLYALCAHAMEVETPNPGLIRSQATWNLLGYTQSAPQHKKSTQASLPYISSIPIPIPKPNPGRPHPTHDADKTDESYFEKICQERHAVKKLRSSSENL